MPYIFQEHYPDAQGNNFDSGNTSASALSLAVLSLVINTEGI